MILVPMETRGIRVVRPLSVFGYDDAPHGHAEVIFENVRVPALQHPARRRPWVEIAQGRLGPGRNPSLHALESELPSGRWKRCATARCRAGSSGRPSPSTASPGTGSPNRGMEIDQARLLTMHAAHMMDTVGNKAARAEIAMIKVGRAQCRAEGDRPGDPVCVGAAVCRKISTSPMPMRGSRALRLADGPDEVHRETVAKIELRKYTAKGMRGKAFALLSRSPCLLLPLPVNGEREKKSRRKAHAFRNACSMRLTVCEAAKHTTK